MGGPSTSLKQEINDKALIHQASRTGNLKSFLDGKSVRSNASKDAIDATYATKVVKQTPRNLMDVPSAYDLSPEHAPRNIYSISSLARAN